MLDAVAGAASPFTNAPSSLSQSTEILKECSILFCFLKGLLAKYLNTCELLPIKAPLLWAG